MRQNYAILVLSCDKYSDLWTPFFNLLWRNWPNCPYTVYLGSNKRIFHHRKVKNILTGKDLNWSSSYKKLLQQIPEKYIFVLLEDVFITQKVNTHSFSECFRFLVKNKGNHIHLKVPSSIHNDPKEAKITTVEPYTPYRAHGIGFWKKDYLLNLLLHGESAWNFEILGSYRTSYDNGFFSLNTQPYSFVHMVVKGKWIPSSLQYCIDNNIAIDVSKRQKMSIYETLSYYLKEYYFKFVYSHIDWKFRVQLMNVLRKVMISY